MAINRQETSFVRGLLKTAVDFCDEQKLEIAALKSRLAAAERVIAVARETLKCHVHGIHSCCCQRDTERALAAYDQEKP